MATMCVGFIERITKSGIYSTVLWVSRQVFRSQSFDILNVFSFGQFFKIWALLFGFLSFCCIGHFVIDRFISLGVLLHCRSSFVISSLVVINSFVLSSLVINSFVISSLVMNSLVISSLVISRFLISSFVITLPLEKLQYTPQYESKI